MATPDPKQTSFLTNSDDNSTRLKLLVQALALTYAMLIGYVIYLSNIGLRGNVFKVARYIPFEDHGAHFLLVGLLALFIGISRKWSHWNLLSLNMLSCSWVLLFVMGLEEAFQSLLPNRTPEMYDLLGNCLGVLVFDWLARQIHSRQLLDKPDRSIHQNAVT